MWHFLSKVAEEKAGVVISPIVIMFAFEKGAHNAALRMLANVDVQCCRFHFGQSVFRDIQKNAHVLQCFSQSESEEVNFAGKFA